MSTVSTKPYLLRAIWEWCVDQGFTPYLATLVDEDTRVPPGYARDGQIVLNLSPDATGQLQMANDFISFQARFGGAAHSLVIPVANVVAIYARENGQGMAFEPELEAVEDASVAVQDPSADVVQDMSDTTAELRRERSAEPQPPARPPRGSHLKIVK
ncbi:MAG TPA: ClpXP protease specificity-enhancing factor [Thauera aminoaromatica]|jgi:stringent starvation protein B|uniref:ClpXP protease specificity-enhancing factor n=2 Tax=Thauera aminoaromatica TaxID=164330 RepID=C4ZNK2_THASP|nr:MULTISPECIES: ClpXP protease specificity-enhancing factor [Thauera]MDA0233461.1 ClpXP protease specificity-enhancing factor [Pseudomonadota bacterium]ACK54165.1 Stringent starvation protein B [Thauera aminoaromatica]ENO81068.1 ClpXP protease specificity-enhancing factor [Thauera aminoaromatica S2]KIN91318.1 stringent starvation B family protein [Thauera sp. SWB20]MBP6132625.1 ClpXP protease specificity-enhancing factor [Thauera sp.]